LPGPQLSAQTASSPVRCASAPAAKAATSVPLMNPLDLALAADRIGQPVQAVADDAIDPLHAGGSEGFCKLSRDGLHTLDSASMSSRPKAFFISTLKPLTVSTAILLG
jgi:hypothetical protein